MLFQFFINVKTFVNHIWTSIIKVKTNTKIDILLEIYLLDKL